jgi:hypothetical protein
MTGKMVRPGADGRVSLGRGDYGKDANNVWWVRMPETGVLVSLLDLAHPVQEARGRVTVGGVLTESFQGGVEFKWKLENGEWRKA